MRTLDGHIGKRVARGYALVVAVLAAAFSVLALVDELDQVGVGQYTFLEVCLFVLLTLPTRLIELAPVIALLGSLIGLGELAGGRELVAMQASGVSPLRIAGSVVKTGALLMLAVVGLQEFIAPPAEQLALTRKTQAISGTDAVRTEQGFWSRDQHQVINVRRVLHGQVPADIDIFQFDAQGRLRLFTRARWANAADSRHWLLMDVEQRAIGEDGINARRLPSLEWESFLTPEQLGILVLPVESLSPSDLYQYVHYLGESGQNAERYELALWQKASMPLATAAMVLVAIPSVFGPLRVSTAGKRLLVGAVVGVAFHVSSQIIGPLGVMFSLHPALTTMAPTAVVLGVALWLFRRIR